MHARSGAWRCCDGKGRAARVQCEQLLAATFIVLCWTLISIDMYCWEAAKRSQAAITELLLFGKSMGVILQDALPASQRLCANRPLKTAKCECLWSRALPSANVCEAGLIAKCECLWSSRTGSSSSHLLLKIKQFCSS